MTESRIEKLFKIIFETYQKYNQSLPFHGWHHINFVTKKAVRFAHLINANEEIVNAAALTHDLNSICEKNSKPEAGKELRANLLAKAEFEIFEIERIENVINEAHTANRTTNISIEGKALSDADTLFKVLPITPLFFTSKYLEENEVNLKKLANKIITEQKPLLEKWIYFYIPEVSEKYLGWAKSHMELWENLVISLEDEEISEILELSGH
jgi:uncharacterized protein